MPKPAFGKCRRDGKSFRQDDPQLDGFFVLVEGLRLQRFDVRFGSGRLLLTSDEPRQESGQQRVMPAVVNRRSHAREGAEGSEGRLKSDGERIAVPSAPASLPRVEVAGTLLHEPPHASLPLPCLFLFPNVRQQVLVSEEPQALLLPHVVDDFVHRRAYGIPEHHRGIEPVVCDGVEEEGVEGAKHRNRKDPLLIAEVSLGDTDEEDQWDAEEESGEIQHGGEKRVTSRRDQGGQRESVRKKQRRHLEQTVLRRDLGKPPGEEVSDAVWRRADVEGHSVPADPQVLASRRSDAALAEKNAGDLYLGEVAPSDSFFDGGIELLGRGREVLEEGVPVGQYSVRGLGHRDFLLFRIAMPLPESSTDR